MSNLAVASLMSDVHHTSVPVAISAALRARPPVEVLVDAPQPQAPGDAQYSGIKNKYFSRLHVGPVSPSPGKPVPMQRRATISADSAPSFLPSGGAAISAPRDTSPMNRLMLNTPPIDIPSNARNALHKVAPPQFTVAAASLPLGTPPLFTPPKWRVGLHPQQRTNDNDDDADRPPGRSRQQPQQQSQRSDFPPQFSFEDDEEPVPADSCDMFTLSSPVTTPARGARRAQNQSQNNQSTTPRAPLRLDDRDDPDADLLDDLELVESDDSIYFEPPADHSSNRPFNDFS